MSRPRQQERTCLFPNCNAPSKCRGLCNHHYGIALQLVRQKRTTWSDMEKHGRAAPKGKVGKVLAARNWFMATDVVNSSAEPVQSEEAVPQGTA